MANNLEAVLRCLREAAESDDGNGFWTVYLDNAYASLPSNITRHQFAGLLSALERGGYYRPIDNYAFGQVKLAD